MKRYFLGLAGLIFVSQVCAQSNVYRSAFGEADIVIASGSKGVSEKAGGEVEDGVDKASADGKDAPVLIIDNKGRDFTVKSPDMVDGVKSFQIASFYGADNIVFTYNSELLVNQISWEGYCYRPEHATKTPVLSVWDSASQQWVFVNQRKASDGGTLTTHDLSAPVLTDKVRFACRGGAIRGYVSEMRIAYIER